VTGGAGLGVSPVLPSGWSSSLLTLALALAVIVVAGQMLLAQEDGQRAFSEAGCAQCHSVEAADLEATVSEGMRGPDLGRAVAAHDAEWLKSVVTGKTELSRGPHRPPFRGTDEELDALATWLVELE